MKEKVVELFSFILVVLLFILMFISSIRITYTTFSLKDYSNYLILIGILGLIIYIISKIKNFKFNKYEIIIIFLMTLSYCSLINCLDLNTALFGMVNRYEGLFVILTYYILILVSMNIKNKKYISIILFLIIIIGLSNLLYGLLQVGILNINSIYVVNKFNYAYGFLGNHMYFGTLMSICLPLVLGIYLKSNNIIKKIIYFILILFFSLGVMIGGAMSTIVALVFVILLIIFEVIKDLKIKNKKTFSNFIFLIITMFCILIGYINFNSEFKKDIFELKNEVVSILNGNIEENFGTGRIYIWKNTIDKFKENWLTGIGIDNFKKAFNPPLLDHMGLIITKAHNEYLQKLLCEGLFSGGLYIIFLLIVFFKNLIKKKNSLYYSLFLAFTSYSIQAFFNISVIRVAPIYFIIIGLLIGFQVKDSGYE